MDTARDLVLRAVEQHEGVRVVGLYLRGSVAQGHAVSRASDLDLMLLVAPLPHRDGSVSRESSDSEGGTDVLRRLHADLRGLRVSLQEAFPFATKVGARAYAAAPSAEGPRDARARSLRRQN